MISVLSVRRPFVSLASSDLGLAKVVLLIATAEIVIIQMSFGACESAELYGLTLVKEQLLFAISWIWKGGRMLLHGSGQDENKVTRHPICVMKKCKIGS